MLRLLRLALLALAAAVAVGLAAYVVGRAQCPPPDWWLAVFVRDGAFACVA